MKAQGRARATQASRNKPSAPVMNKTEVDKRMLKCTSWQKDAQMHGNQETAALCLLSNRDKEDPSSHEGSRDPTDPYHSSTYCPLLQPGPTELRAVQTHPKRL